MTSEEPQLLRGHRHWFALGFILVLIIAIRMPGLTDKVIDLDESVIAVHADRILDGGVAYRAGVGHRGPITYYFCALIFHLFGRFNMMALHLVLLGIYLFVAHLIYYLGTIMFDKRVGWCSSLLYSYRW